MCGAIVDDGCDGSGYTKCNVGFALATPPNAGACVYSKPVVGKTIIVDQESGGTLACPKDIVQSESSTPLLIAVTSLLASSTQYAQVGFGKCTDAVNLTEGAFPAHLADSNHDDYSDDYIRQCLNRCQSAHSASTGFFVRASDLKCKCSQGSCATVVADINTAYLSLIHI